MDQRPIGVFDSGQGGLTAVREIQSILPSENIIYFGDTSRVPYGGRSPEILLHYARQDVHFLRSFDVKALLVACGTVSTNALPVLAAESDIPILGVVEPACAAAAAATLRRHCDRGQPVAVQMPGGELTVRWLADGRMLLTGEAVYVFRGEWEEAPVCRN